MGTPETPQERPRDPQNPPETLQDLTRDAPVTPRDLRRTPRDRPRTLQRRPAIPRDASDPPKEPRTAQGRPGIARAPARSQKSSKRAPRDAQETKMSSQAIQKGAKHPRASHQHIFLSVSRFPSAQVSYQQVFWSVSRFPPAQAFGEGGNTPTRVTSAGLPVNLLLSPCSIHPAKSPWMRRSRVASPIMYV